MTAEKSLRRDGLAAVQSGLAAARHWHDRGRYYVIVNAQYTYTPALPYSVFGSALTLTAQSTVRIQ